MSEPRLSARERDVLLDMARRVMPGGQLFPDPEGSVLERFEALLAEAPAGLSAGLRGALSAFEHSARLRHGVAYSDLDEARREAHLQAWVAGGALRRNLLRAVLILLKIYRYADGDLYRRLGCRYGAPPAARPQERWREKVVHAADLNGQRVVDADVVVVGTGAGGAVVARELAERGLAVAVLEEGEYFTRAEFSGRPAEMQRRLYRQLGMTVSLGNTPIYCPVGRSVGGSTTVNSGTCLRPPAARLQRWVDELGLAGYGPRELAPYLDRVEEVLQVSPARADLLGNNARLVARGADRLGLEHGPLKRNAPDCDGSGLCPFGCPTDAKRSTNVSYMPLALQSSAFLYTGLKAERVLIEGGRAVGVVATSKAHGKRLEVRGRAVALACGSLHTPLLLKRSGLRGRALGGNLSLHPCGQVGAEFPEQVDGFRGIPQGYWLRDAGRPGISFEGVSVPLELSAAMFDMVGEELTRTMERFRHLSTFGFMVDDTSRGRVLGEAAGWPLMTYWLNRRDFALVREGLETLARVYFAAGARRVYLPVNGHRVLESQWDLERFREARVRPGDVELGAFHPLGTCRLGSSPRTSVLNPEGETWQVRDLFVTDGSAIPTALGVNPQVTIMAVATKAAEGIAARLS